MPVQSQLSSVNAIEFADVNSDGKPDLITGGNNFNFPPQFGRLDASFGDVYLNKGNNIFQWVDPAFSGIKLNGEIKDIKPVNGKTAGRFIITQNEKAPVLYQLNKTF